MLDFVKSLLYSAKDKARELKKMGQQNVTKMKPPHAKTSPPQKNTHTTPPPPKKNENAQRTLKKKKERDNKEYNTCGLSQKI